MQCGCSRNLYNDAHYVPGNVRLAVVRTLAVGNGKKTCLPFYERFTERVTIEGQFVWTSQASRFDTTAAYVSHGTNLFD